MHGTWMDFLSLLYSCHVMDTEQIVVTLTSPTQQVNLSGLLRHDKYAIRWVQCTGFNFPTDTLVIISGSSSAGLDFGTATSTNIGAPGRCFVVPLPAATATVKFEWPLLCINRKAHGIQHLTRGDDNIWSFNVRTNTTVVPTFTSLTICFESVA